MSSELTIREKEAKKIENINKSKQQMQEWGIYRYPTPTKKVKSLSMLRKKIVEFFNEHDADAKADKLPTPTQLAVYLGYSSSSAMYNDIRSNSYPEYSALLDRAVDVIKDNLQRRQLHLAEKKDDWKGIDAVLQRIDSAQGITSNTTNSNVNVNITIEQKEKIKSLVDDRLSFLKNAKVEDALVIEPKELCHKTVTKEENVTEKLQEE